MGRGFPSRRNHYWLNLVIVAAICSVRVLETHWVTPRVVIEIGPIYQTCGVNTCPPSQPRCGVARPVVVKFCLLVPLLTRVAIALRCRLDVLIHGLIGSAAVR